MRFGQKKKEHSRGKKRSSSTGVFFQRQCGKGKRKRDHQMKGGDDPWERREKNQSQPRDLQQAREQPQRKAAKARGGNQRRSKKRGKGKTEIPETRQKGAFRNSGVPSSRGRAKKGTCHPGKRKESGLGRRPSCGNAGCGEEKRGGTSSPKKGEFIFGRGKKGKKGAEGVQYQLNISPAEKKESSREERSSKKKKGERNFSKKERSWGRRKKNGRQVSVCSRYSQKKGKRGKKSHPNQGKKEG